MFRWQAHQVSSTAMASALKADSAAGKVSDIQNQTRQLEERIDRLELCNAALWSLLEEKVGLTEEELVERIRQIDLSDGVLDGKVNRAPAKCPNCDRTLHKRHMNCIYCGHKVERAPFQP